LIGLGSNLGEKLGNIARAVHALRALKGVRVTALSSIYLTSPVGSRRQPCFYNAAARVSTTLPPARLLARMKAIEKDLGRRRSWKGGPRIIDLDLLLHGSRIVKNRGVIVPHPRMHERAFVLLPCAEIAGGMFHPTTRMTIRRMAALSSGEGNVLKLKRGVQNLFRKSASRSGRSGEAS